MVLHEQSNNTASFTEHLKFQKKYKKNFEDALWINCSQLKENN